MQITVLHVIGATTFLISLFDKWKVFQFLIECYLSREVKFFYKLFNCQFCMNFWLSLAVSFLFMLIDSSLNIQEVFLLSIMSSGIISMWLRR